VSNYSNYLLAKVVVEQEPITLKKYELNGDALRMTQVGTPLDFYATFGDRFISDMTLGGYLYALIIFQASSRAQYDDTAAKFDFKVINFGAADAAFAEKLRRFRTTTSYNVIIIKNGGSDTIPNIDTLLEEIKGFSKSVRENDQVVTSFSVLDYNKAVNRRLGFKFVETSQAISALQTLSGYESDQAISAA
jgi:hypothetical protein